MFKIYLKLAFRNINKYRISSFINIFGLALAVGCCLMVFEYTHWAFHQDNFNSRLDRLFVIEKVISKNDSHQNYGDVPSPLGPVLKNDLSQIKNSARLNYTDVVMGRAENLFRENITFVDDAFYDMFDYPVKWGDKEHFTDKDAIVLTEQLSEKLFGATVNPIGKTVTIRFNIKGSVVAENVFVKGVLKRYPSQASFGFSALIPHAKMGTLGLDKAGDWDQSADITFIELNNEQDLASVSSNSAKYVKRYNSAQPDEKISSFYFQPLKSMNFHSYQVANSRFSTMEPIGLIMLLVIAVSILLLVYFNYINVTIASASGRLKEISVRKVMGSSKTQIIFQFIVENLIVCAIAVFFGLLLAEIFFLPWFSSISGFQVGAGFFSNSRTWLAALGFVIVSAFSGAIYPAYYIASLNTVGMMRGHALTGSKNHFRNVLLALQFFLTFISISTAIAFAKETKAIKSKPWGYRPDHTIVVAMDNTSVYTSIEQQLKMNKNVEGVTGAVQPLGNYTKEIQINNGGKSELVKSISILPGFIDQLGIKISEGRDFSKNFSTDQRNAVIVNQAFAKMMNWSVAVGKSIIYNHQKYLVVGLVGDFHYESFATKIEPMVMLNCKPDEVKFMYVRYADHLLLNMPEEIKRKWQHISPDTPFDYHFQDEVFNGYFYDWSKVSRVLSVVSIFMTFISISGVFGMALIISGKKMKEISIRKVLGADIKHIIYVIYKEFLLPLLSAVLIGFPLSYIITSSMFGAISVGSKFSALPIVLGGIVLICTTSLSVSWHIYKAYTANVSQYLKDQ